MAASICTLTTPQFHRIANMGICSDLADGMCNMAALYWASRPLKSELAQCVLYWMTTWANARGVVMGGQEWLWCGVTATQTMHADMRCQPYGPRCTGVQHAQTQATHPSRLGASLQLIHERRMSIRYVI